MRNWIADWAGLCGPAVAALALAVAPAAAAAPGPVLTAPMAPPAPPAPPPPLPQGTPVHIGFAPPLDRPLEYIHSEEKTEKGAPRNVAARLIVRFTKAGEGYLMEGWTEIPGLSPEQAASPEVRFALRPVTFRLSSDGAFVGIEGEADYWSGLDAMAEAIMKDPKMAAADKPLLRSIFHTMRELPLEQRLTLIAKNFLPITAFAATDMTVGETATTAQKEARLPVPGLNAKVALHYDITLKQANAASAEIESIARFDPRALALMLAELQKLAPPGRPAEPPPALSQEAVSWVSRQTGLTATYTETTRMEGAGSEAPVRVIRLVLVSR